MGQGFESLLAYQVSFLGIVSKLCHLYVVGVAQLVRAPDCGSGCRGFESHLPPQTKVGDRGYPDPLFSYHIGASPSGKARDFDSLIRWFESSRPSQSV